jgi:hypothetical protein
MKSSLNRVERCYSTAYQAKKKLSNCHNQRKREKFGTFFKVHTSPIILPFDVILYHWKKSQYFLFCKKIKIK